MCWWIYFNKDEDDDVRAKFEYCKAAGISMMVAVPADPLPGMMESFAYMRGVLSGMGYATA